MLIEQIIEFELRVHGPLVVHIFLKLVIFMTKQKFSKANLRVHYFMLKCCRKQCILISVTNVKSQNLTPKCKILSAFWTSPEVKGVICSIGFQISKILFFHQKITKNRQAAGCFAADYHCLRRLRAPLPHPVCDMFELH